MKMCRIAKITLLIAVAQLLASGCCSSGVIAGATEEAFTASVEAAITELESVVQREKFAGHLTAMLRSIKGEDGQSCFYVAKSAGLCEAFPSWWKGNRSRFVFSKTYTVTGMAIE